MVKKTKYIKIKDIAYDKAEAKRMLAADDAFYLLLDIETTLRGYLKYGTKKNKQKIMEEVRNVINDSCLLELYK
jgi:hypothetical protein